MTVHSMCRDATAAERAERSVNALRPFLPASRRPVFLQNVGVGDHSNEEQRMTSKLHDQGLAISCFPQQLQQLYSGTYKGLGVRDERHNEVV